MITKEMKPAGKKMIEVLKKRVYIVKFGIPVK